MKRGTVLAGALAAFAGALLFPGGGCRGRDEATSPSDTPLDHSQKSPSSSSSSLPFVFLSLDEALVRARAEKKLVFVDLHADWCHWCTKMDEDVFIDPRVRAALLDFVPIKVDTDKSGGRAVANRYRVNGLPAFLVLDADGGVVRRFDGYLPVEVFLRKLGPATGAGS